MNTDKPQESKSQAKGITSTDLQRAIAAEISLFVEENRSEIVRRAHKRLQREGKSKSNG